VRDGEGKFSETPGGPARRVRLNRADDIPLARSSTARQRFSSKTGKLKRINEVHARAMSGDPTLSRRDEDLVEYASPKLRDKSRRERGTVVRPKSESLSVERGRTRAFRDVAVNPATGKFVAVSGDGSRDRRYLLHSDNSITTREGLRPSARASAVRKKQATTPRPKLAKPAYVGRRRADP